MKNPVFLTARGPFAAATLTAVALALAAPALAQTNDEGDAAAAEEEIILQYAIPSSTITVWGERSWISDTPANVAIVTEADLNRWQSVTVADPLTRIPGVTATSNGQIGSFTGVRIRGADAAQTLVIIDGVRVGDPSSPGGGFDFGNLTSAGVARVEVLNGSNSLAWGSDAIGGVVIVDTADGADGRLRASSEYGSHDLARASLGGGTRIGALTIGGNLGYVRTDGISAAAAGTEADGFRQFSGNGRVTLDLGTVTLRAALVHASGRLDLDGYAPPTFSFGDTSEYQETQENYASASAEHRWAMSGGTVLINKLTASLADINRDSFDPAAGPAPSFAARGRTDRFGWSGQLSLSDSLSILSGIEHERSRMATSSAFSADRQSTAISAGWVQARLEPADGLLLGGGVRLSDHRDFGGNAVFAANVSWLPTDDKNWKVRASFAEGYKAPTLFQLSSDPGAYGNPDLAPERSSSYDFGFDYALLGNRYTISATLFRRDSDNLIDFVGCSGTGQPAICAGGTRPFGTYANIAKARAEGLEASATVQLTPAFTASVGYAHIATRDRTIGRFSSGNRLARRPVDTATLALDYDEPNGAFSIGTELRYVGSSFDDAGNSVRLDEYALVGVRGTIAITADIQLYVRVDNLFDEDYQNVATYGTYGRTFAFGIRWTG